MDLLEKMWGEAERISAILSLVNRVIEGDLVTPIEVTISRNDPYFGLFNALNDMILALHEAHERRRAYERELEEKLQLIEKQQEAIRELSTPVIEVGHGILCLPVMGLVDSVRATEITESLMMAVAERKAHAVILDVTGIDAVDTSTVDHFVRTASCIHLLGAECILSGISPVIAQSLVELGIELRKVRTCGSLREGLELADTLRDRARRRRRR